MIEAKEMWPEVRGSCLYLRMSEYWREAPMKSGEIQEILEKRRGNCVACGLGEKMCSLQVGGATVTNGGKYWSLDEWMRYLGENGANCLSLISLSGDTNDAEVE